MVKKLIIAGMVLVCVLTSAAFAPPPLLGQTLSTPWVISFQGKLDGATGDTADLTFKMYAVVENNYQEIWTEDHPGVDISDNGIFNVLLGSTSPLSESKLLIDGVDLEIIVNGTPLQPKQPLTAAPFAVVAKTVNGNKVIASDTSSSSIIWGRNNGTGYGIQGVAVSADRAGVYGQGLSDAYGVYGKVDVNARSGVYGENTAATQVYPLDGQRPVGAVAGKGDAMPGVVGYSNGFPGVVGFSGTNNAVAGIATAADKAGVAGSGVSGGYGVRGEGQKGGGVFESTGGHGVEANATAGNKAAVYAKHIGALSGNAILAESDKGIVIMAYALANSDSTAIYGDSAAGDGITGKAYAVDKSGIRGIGGVDGHGVYAVGAGGRAAMYALNTSTGHAVQGRAQGGGTGVLGQSGTGNGVIGSTDNANHEWGLNTQDKAYARYGFYTNQNTGGFFSGNYDIAEWIGNIKKQVEAGDVVVADPDNVQNVIKSAKAYDSSVIGIISTKPGYLGGEVLKDQLGEDKAAMLALAGVVPCKVSAENGPIAIGDLLTSSNTPGHAMKATDPKFGTIVGKALEALPAGTGKIKVLVTLQ